MEFRYITAMRILGAKFYFYNDKYCVKLSSKWDVPFTPSDNYAQLAKGGCKQIHHDTYLKASGFNLSKGSGIIKYEEPGNESLDTPPCKEIQPVVREIVALEEENIPDIVEEWNAMDDLEA